MNLATLTSPMTTRAGNSKLPVTPRGRALYTLDWFLNGKPVLRNHDNPCLSLRNGLSC